ncbi:MAG: hypothetical protein HQ567_08530 [Candidatus Nealsonbacteria bacterium]|nr:hypothetical protein [Candidatus Nealsonbacteria bacterium]
MHKLRWACSGLLGVVFLLAPGCVELTGQRITWFYDEAEDQLLVLLHYDGIHESQQEMGEKSADGAQQIPEFVANGDVMLLDWPFHLHRAGIQKKADDESTDSLERRWAQQVLKIQTRPIGYYREPNGRIGAAQMVVVPKVKQFVRELNELINAQIVKDGNAPREPYPRTMKRIYKAAKDDHQWATLEGHAIHIRVPVDPSEWAGVKAEFLKDVFQQGARSSRPDATEEEKMQLASLIRFLSSAPLSVIDRGDEVEFVLGASKRPSTLRAQLRDEYEKSLEKVTIKEVKVDLDEVLAERLLEPDTKTSADVSAVLDWGPPEERVRGLLAAAERDGPDRKKTAITQLRDWAKQWNRDHGVPKAPAETDDTEAYLAAWKQWYARMRQFPMAK